MKKIIMSAVSLPAAVSFMNVQDAVSIVDAARDRITIDTISTRSHMVITAKNGSTLVSQITLFLPLYRNYSVVA